MNDPAYLKELAVPPAERRRDQAGRIPHTQIPQSLRLFGEKGMPRFR